MPIKVDDDDDDDNDALSVEGFTTDNQTIWINKMGIVLDFVVNLL